MMLLMVVVGLVAVTFLALLAIGLCRLSAQSERFAEVYRAQERSRRQLVARTPTKRAA